MGNLLLGAQGGERRETHVYPHLAPGLWPPRGLDARAGAADGPLAGTAAANGSGLGRALQGPLQDHLHLPDVHDAQALGRNVQVAADRHLRDGEALGAPRAANAWRPGRLADGAAAAERLEGQVDAHGDMLQHLRLDAGQRGPFGFEGGQGKVACWS